MFNSIGDRARVIFSLGTRILESDLNGQNVRVLVENNDGWDLGSFDYNYAKSVFYVADNKNSKVTFNKYTSGMFLLKKIF